MIPKKKRGILKTNIFGLLLKHGEKDIGRTDLKTCQDDRVNYNEYLDGIRQQLIDLCERVRNDKERTEREEKGISE